MREHRAQAHSRLTRLGMGREPHAADWQGRSYIHLEESTYTHTPSRTSESILQLSTKIPAYPSSFLGRILGILLVLFLDSLCKSTRMITIKPRPRSGVFLESTNAEAFGVSPGEDRLVKETMDREVIPVEAFTSVKQAIETMGNRSPHIVAVCQDGEPISALTECDVATSERDESRGVTARECPSVEKRRRRFANFGAMGWKA